MAIDMDVLSSTIAKIHPEATMGLYKNVPFLRESLNRKKFYPINGSYEVRVAVETNVATVPTAITNGYEQLDMSAGNTLDYAAFQWSTVVQPIIISKRDEMQNSGDEAIIDLAGVRHESILQSMMRQLNQQLLVGSVAGWTEFGTLNGTTTSGVAGGFLENAAPGAGAQTHVVGGLSKATYAGVPGWQNQYATGGGNFAQNGLSNLRTVRTRASLYSPRADRPFDLLVLHPDCHVAFENQLQSYIRYLDAGEIDTGKVAPVWEGSPVYADAAFLGISGSGANLLSGYGLNLQGVQLALHDEGNFKFEDFVMLPDQEVMAARIRVSGCLIARNLGCQAVLTNLNA